jgi:hypothetical protein
VSLDKDRTVEIPELVQEWIAVGEMRNECRMILRLGAKRFGLAPDGTEAALRAITDFASNG